MNKKQLLQNPIQHIDITKPAYAGVVDIMEDMSNMAFQSRNIARGARIFSQMIGDQDCTIYLTLAGSLESAGLKKVIVDFRFCYHWSPKYPPYSRTPEKQGRLLCFFV